MPTDFEAVPSWENMKCYMNGQEIKMDMEKPFSEQQIESFEGEKQETIMLPERTITAKVEWRSIIPYGKRSRKRMMFRALKIMKTDRLTRMLTAYINNEIKKDRKACGNDNL